MKLGLTCVAYLCLVGVVWAAPAPKEQIKKTADKIIAILNNPDLQGEPKKTERRRLIRQELDERFNWNAICRSCLGHHWSKLSTAQQAQFNEEFTQFLERTYLDQLEPFYGDLIRIDYQGERILENNYAQVKTVFVTKQKVEHPVEYRLEKAPSGDWRVYDVIIEGVSLIKNYRTQFDEILNKSNFETLIKDLKTKQIPVKE
jgi:phospholipid transport system substrate-binding protein